VVPFALVLSTIAQASCITCSAEQNTERAVKLAEGDDLQFTVQVVQLDDVDANRYSEVFVSFRLLHSGEVFRTGTHKGTSPWPVARFGCCGERSSFARVGAYSVACTERPHVINYQQPVSVAVSPALREYLRSSPMVFEVLGVAAAGGSPAANAFTAGSAAAAPKPAAQAAGADSSAVGSGQPVAVGAPVAGGASQAADHLRGIAKFAGPGLRGPAAGKDKANEGLGPNKYVVHAPA